MPARSFDNQHPKHNPFESYINGAEFAVLLEGSSTPDQIKERVQQIIQHLIHDMGVNYWENHMDELQIQVRKIACDQLVEEFQRLYPTGNLQTSDWEYMITATITLGWLAEIAIINELRKGRQDSDSSANH